MKEETYSISRVSQMTGVSKNRIREWHSKGLLPQVYSAQLNSPTPAQLNSPTLVV